MNLMINISRLHPLFVHLPIGILVFAAILYGLKKWNKSSQYDASLYVALWCAFGTAVFSTASGMLLSNEGGYDTDILFWHKWFGISTTISVLLMLILYKKQKLAKKYLGILFVISMGLLTFTGHHGGSLTHGTEYLFETPVSDDLALLPGVKPEDMVVYKDLIQPIFNKKCISCHKAGKQKGDLIMTSFTALMKGGKSGPIINVKSPSESELLNRLLLPLSDKKHMPPKGKIQVSDDEITLLNWWIENKACEGCQVKELEGRENVDPILEKYVEAASNLKLVGVEPLSDRQVNALERNGIMLSSISSKNPLVSLGIRNEKEVSKAAIQSMKSISENIKEINLAESTVNEALIDYMADLPNLHTLHLQYSSVTDEDIKKLSGLENLEVLNLYATSISDQSIEQLAKFPSLKKLFVWQSKMSPKGVEELQNKKPELEIFNGIDESIFGKSSLNPPKILSEIDLFEDTLTVRLKTNLKNSTIYYTLDGSDPDSTSMVYAAPILLNGSIKVKAITNKKGWGASTIESKQFVQLKKNIIKSIKLSKSPSPNYPGKGPKTLIDLTKSNTDFKNGKWLGFEGTHITATLELKQIDTLKSVFISSISDPASWIHYPKGAVVSISEDGKNFKEVQQIEITDENREGLKMSYFDILFEPTPCKYIKVEVKSILKNPEWHASPGGKAWLFIDEIMVN